MLIGGWGPGAAAVVGRAAECSGLELIADGELVLAAPAGALAHGRTERHRVWFTGRLEVDGIRGDVDSAGPSVAECAAAAFDRLGCAAQAHLYGAYVLVALDPTRRLVRVSHDHLGARPVVYVLRGDQALFAEHIVHLLELLQATPDIDRLAVVQWLDRGTLPAGRSLFSGVSRLPPGHALELSSRDSATRRFWWPVYREPEPSSRSESASAAVSATFAAVGRATAGLRRPAVKLSGGLDSACVSAGLGAASEHRRGLALSRTFPEHPAADETSLIEETADMTGLELIELPYSDTPILPAVWEYIGRWRLPPASPNMAVWQPLMAAARARGVDGLLDGEGGDSLFGAFPYLLADRLRQGRLLSAWRLAGRLPGLGADPRTRVRLIGAIGVRGAVPPMVHQVWPRLRAPRGPLGPFASEADLPGLVAEDDRWSWKAGGGPLWWRWAVDQLVNVPDRVDASGHLRREAVQEGVDRRHPLLHDARLLEAMLSISPEYAFDSVRDRALLRDGLARLVPESVRTRYAKSSFNAVVTRPLTGDEGAALRTQLASPAAPVRDYVRDGSLEALRRISGARGHQGDRLASALFRAVAVNCWLSALSDPPAAR